MREFIRKLRATTFWKKSEVVLGTGNVTQFIVWENKYFCSCILYTWQTIDQVRAHSHAFNAVTFLLHGWYWEDILLGDRWVRTLVNQPLWPRYIPKGYVHAVKDSKPGTKTLLFCGPWQNVWWECFPANLSKGYLTDMWVKYTWGRQKISSSPLIPKSFVENRDE